VIVLLEHSFSWDCSCYPCSEVRDKVASANLPKPPSGLHRFTPEERAELEEAQMRIARDFEDMLARPVE
jgi:hypothetical protein